jgi:hypothetical protein
MNPSLVINESIIETEFDYLETEVLNQPNSTGQMCVKYLNNLPKQISVNFIYH